MIHTEELNNANKSEVHYFWFSERIIGDHEMHANKVYN